MTDGAHDAAGGPRHIAVIIDGNGRWARARGKPKTAGHRQGAEAARRVVHAAGRVGISYLTLFAFSSENWKRSAREVDELMWLLRTFIQRELDALNENDVRLRVIGDCAALPGDLQHMLARAEARTRANCGLTVTVALNYGGRQDIVQATSALACAAVDGALDTDAIDTRQFARARHRGHPRPRPAGADQRRTADQQFPTLAVRPRRVAVPG